LDAQNEISAFRGKNPALAQKYALIGSSVDLELEHENRRFLDVMLAMGELKELLPNDAAIQDQAKRRIELHRQQHDGTVKWWKELAAQMDVGEELYLFSYSENGKNESGYLTIKQGAIKKRFSQESQDLLLPSTAGKDGNGHTDGGH
jgi:hypothetical protein